MVKEAKAQISEIIKYSENLWVFRFNLKGSELNFVPGQFVMLSIPGLVDANGQKVSRAYSISSAPEQDYVELCIVRHRDGSLSPTLFKLKAGDEAILSGPFGKFLMKKPVKPQTVFIAGGTGIAPIISMLRHLYLKGFNEPLWLFYSVGQPELLLFREELLAYRENNKLKLVISTSKPNPGWKWEKGRVTDTFPTFAPEISKKASFYICGPPQMVPDVILMLEELGFKKELVYREQW